MDRPDMIASIQIIIDKNLPVTANPVLPSFNPVEVCESFSQPIL
jgi:hypothetical protein